MLVRECHCHYSSAHISIQLQECTDLHIRLRLPVVISPQTEKILSTNACEARAPRRSSASGASSLYEDLQAAQKPSASSTVDRSNSAI